MASEPNRDANGSAVAGRKRGCIVTVCGESVSKRTAARSSRCALAILVHDAGRETGARHVVAAGIAGDVRTDAGARGGRKDWSCGVAHGDCAAAMTGMHRNVRHRRKAEMTT